MLRFSAPTVLFSIHLALKSRLRIRQQRIRNRARAKCRNQEMKRAAKAITNLQEQLQAEYQATGRVFPCWL